MSLVGRLEDLSLGEILQIVSLSKRSGLLRLESPDGRASLYIKAGKVIYAASTEEKEDILNLLAENDMIRGDQLESFREKLESVPSPQEFRDLLIESAGISHDKLQEILKTRVEELTYALFIWEEGTFSFQLIEDETTHPHLSKVTPFFLDEGIGAQFLVMEGARRKDEMMRDALSVESPGRSPMVDPESVLNDNWEQEFEQHLAGPSEETEEIGPDETLEAELDEFTVPEVLPPLPGSFCGKIVGIGLKAPLVVEITGSLVREGIELLIQENGADALAKIQDLRQQGEEPYLLMDVEAPGITDGRELGGLEIISTMWDFGFHLPVGLVCGTDIDKELETALNTVSGLSIFRMPSPVDPDSVQQILKTVSSLVDVSLGQQEDPEDVSPSGIDESQVRTEVSLESPDSSEQDVQGFVEVSDDKDEYYDIQQDFSEELEEIDLSIDDWEEGQALPREVSLDPVMARLSSYVSELNRQDISGEITLLALRFASDFVNRAILFLVRKDDIKGLGQFGVDLGEELNADSVVRSLKVPLDDNSLFARVAQQRISYKGPPTDSGTEAALFKALGGGQPHEIFIGPIVSMGKVAVLLYGDDYPLCSGLEPTHTLDIFLSHVGLALDRAFLEMKLKSQKS